MTPLAFEQPVLAFVSGAAGCLVLGHPLIRGLAQLRWVQPVRHHDCPPLLPLHQGKQGTPTMGGLLVLGVAGVTAAALGGLSRREGWLVLGAMVGLGLIGLVDDLLKLAHPNANGLSKLAKLVVALGLGAVIGGALADPSLGYREVAVPWLGLRVSPGALWIPLAMGVIAGCAHAVNLTDGMDGLAVGCLAIAFLVLGFTAWLGPQDQWLGIWCAALAGACVGFLWFNSFPASVFLGDVGALGLGGALGAVALLSHATLALIVIGGVFVAEAVSVMLQVASYRWFRRRRLFRVAPLHHHFQVGGIHEQKLVVRFWIVGLLLAALGLTALTKS